MRACREILQHEELRDKLKTACLGALLQRDEVRRLEERYLSGKEVSRDQKGRRRGDRRRVSLLFPRPGASLLVAASSPSERRRKVERRQHAGSLGRRLLLPAGRRRHSGDGGSAAPSWIWNLYLFSLQVIDGSLADMRCHLGDDGAGSPEAAAHLERFLLR